MVRQSVLEDKLMLMCELANYSTQLFVCLQWITGQKCARCSLDACYRTIVESSEAHKNQSGKYSSNKLGNVKTMSNSTALYSQCTTTCTSQQHETQTAAVTRIQTYIHSAAQIPKSE